MKQLTKITDFKDLKPYWNFKGEEMLLHFDANAKSGIFMPDPEGIVPKAVKEIAKKVAGKIMTGKLADMSTIS